MAGCLSVRRLFITRLLKKEEERKMGGMIAINNSNQWA